MHRHLPRPAAKAQSHDSAMLMLILGAGPLCVIAISFFSIFALFIR